MAYYGSSAAAASSSSTIKDRTSEFRSYVTHHKAALAAGNQSSHGQGSGTAPARKPPTKGEFAKRAAAIGKDISDTTVKLARLAECESASDPALVLMASGGCLDWWDDVEVRFCGSARRKSGAGGQQRRRGHVERSRRGRYIL